MRGVQRKLAFFFCALDENLFPIGAMVESNCAGDIGALAAKATAAASVEIEAASN
jgi:hypothetical protein